MGIIKLPSWLATVIGIIVGMVVFTAYVCFYDRNDIGRGQYKLVEQFYEDNPYVREVIRKTFEDSTITNREFDSIKGVHKKTAKLVFRDRIAKDKELEESELLKTRTLVGEE